jgi:hypothetical protein
VDRAAVVVEGGEQVFEDGVDIGGETALVIAFANFLDPRAYLGSSEQALWRSEMPTALAASCWVQPSPTNSAKRAMTFGSVGARATCRSLSSDARRLKLAQL